MEGDVWRLQCGVHTWAYFTLSLEERSSGRIYCEVHSVYPTCISEWTSRELLSSNETWKAHDVQTSHFIEERYMWGYSEWTSRELLSSNGRVKLHVWSATNTPHMGILHLSLEERSMKFILYILLYLSSMEGDVWRLQTLHTSPSIGR